MNWNTYFMGVATPPLVALVYYLLAIAWERIRWNSWVYRLHWHYNRVYQRWQWSEDGAALSFTFKKRPAWGIAVCVRPWRRDRKGLKERIDYQEREKAAQATRESIKPVENP